MYACVYCNHVHAYYRLTHTDMEEIITPKHLLLCVHSYPLYHLSSVTVICCCVFIPIRSTIYHLSLSSAVSFLPPLPSITCHCHLLLCVHSYPLYHLSPVTVICCCVFIPIRSTIYHLSLSSAVVCSSLSALPSITCHCHLLLCVHSYPLYHLSPVTVICCCVFIPISSTIYHPSLSSAVVCSFLSALPSITCHCHLLLCVHSYPLRHLSPVTVFLKADREEIVYRQKIEEARKLRKQKIEEEQNYSDEESGGSNAGSRTNTPKLTAPISVSMLLVMDRYPPCVTSMCTFVCTYMRPS